MRTMSNLKNRVAVTDSGFMLKMLTNEDRKAFYYRIELADLPDMERRLIPAHYFTPMSADDNKLDMPGCYEVIEQQDGRTVDKYDFYYAGGEQIPELHITTQPDKKYGEDACRITIEWDEEGSETINGRYIWLEDQYGMKYEFLTDEFIPSEKKHRWVDEYIYCLPDDSNVVLSVHVDELLQQRYQVIIE